MKILIAGTGSIGRRHLHNLVALGVNDIILYSTGRSRLPSEDFAGFPMFRNLQEALDSGPEAVVVANPTACHMDVAIPAAQKGCHVLLEKPVSHDLARVDDLRAALKSGGGSLLVGYQFRFHPTLCTLAEGVRQGVIGRILSARAEWGEYLPDWHPWEDYRLGYAARKELGGGVTKTLSHPFDYLRWILGEVSELIWAHPRCTGFLDLAVDDEVEAGFRFNCGAVASVHLDFIHRPPIHRLDVVGTEGIVSWNASDGKLIWSPGDGAIPRQEMPPHGFGRNTLFLEEMSHFLAVAQGKVSPRCTLEDGIRALEIVQNILASPAWVNHDNDLDHAVEHGAPGLPKGNE